MEYNKLSEKVQKAVQGAKHHAKTIAGATALIAALGVGMKQCKNGKGQGYKIETMDRNKALPVKAIFNTGEVQIPYTQNGNPSLLTLSNIEQANDGFNKISYTLNYLDPETAESKSSQEVLTYTNLNTLSTQIGSIFDKYFPNTTRQRIPEKIQEGARLLSLSQEAKKLGIKINTNAVEFNILFAHYIGGGDSDISDYDISIFPQNGKFIAKIDGNRLDNDTLEADSIPALFNNLSETMHSFAGNVTEDTTDKINYKLNIAEKVFTQVIKQTQQ